AGVAGGGRLDAEPVLVGADVAVLRLDLDRVRRTVELQRDRDLGVRPEDLVDLRLQDGLRLAVLVDDVVAGERRRRGGTLLRATVLADVVAAKRLLGDLAPRGSSADRRWRCRWRGTCPRFGFATSGP